MARDLFHQLVREALEADGWIITHDPLILKAGGLRLEIDLAAEQVFVAQRGPESIAVEVKSFLSKSKLNDFYLAKGQYDVYREVLNKDINPRKLYLAVDNDIYQSFLQKSLIAEILESDAISLLVFDVLTKRVVEWITR
ncbi:element excision factor XisH family protein [Arsenicibacter rosenii]|uniref:Fatty-acid oxidation protein subunit alpha n=1 Tax=Arsenicibacter rosenii TaxID=1750698 RepID=A0A1S2VPS4_9BACT|nr:element excision factor XisH family protein [Arsenicibacter rosenii]OIN60235.1 fatty-acid oxidation protein subunit alpha [Arsenicibacter rosenii]